MWKASEKADCIIYRDIQPFDPLSFVVNRINEKLKAMEKLGIQGKNKAKETKIAIKAYGCEFDNYLTCKTEDELNEQLRNHRREHLKFWDEEYSCRTNVPFENTTDDEEYDRRAKTFVKGAHINIMNIKVILPRDCTVFHGLVGFRSTFTNPYRYMSTTLDLMMAYNFAGNEDLTDKVSPLERSDYEVILELRLPAGTECFSTNVCYCVQEEDEITLVSNDEINIEVFYDEKRLVQSEFPYYGLRSYYIIPALLKHKKILYHS